MCQRQTSCIYIHSNCTLTACPWIPEGRGCGGSAPAPLCHPSLVMMKGNYNFWSLYSSSYFVSVKEDFTSGLFHCQFETPSSARPQLPPLHHRGNGIWRQRRKQWSREQHKRRWILECRGARGRGKASWSWGSVWCLAFCQMIVRSSRQTKKRDFYKP